MGAGKGPCELWRKQGCCLGADEARGETHPDLRSAGSRGLGGGTAQVLSPGGSLAQRRQQGTAGGTGSSAFPGHALRDKGHPVWPQLGQA